MVEFAVVLMLKRIVQFNDSQTELEDSNIKSMQKYIEASNPTKLNNKRGTSEGDISKVDLEIDAEFSRHTAKFTVTEMIDFAALCIFLTSYASLTCIYMTYYCACHDCQKNFSIFLYSVRYIKVLKSNSQICK